MYFACFSLQPFWVSMSHLLAGFVFPLIFTISIRKINTSPPLILPPCPPSPYPSSDGMYISHLSPSTMSCIASVQPLMTWFGAKVVGSPRLYDESNLGPLGKLPAVRPS